MLARFMAAASVGSLTIACAALGTLAIPGMAPRQFYPLTLVWCFVPMVWGVWALLTPSKWMPRALPAWGALLGLLAGLAAAFVRNLPMRVLGSPVGPEIRLAGVACITLVYYLLWIVVRFVYDMLVAPLEEMARQRAAATAEPCAEVAQHVSEAYELLGSARSRSPRHPEVDEAIARLEMALSLLTLKTGGML
jgi:hypothetical protein